MPAWSDRWIACGGAGLLSLGAFLGLAHGQDRPAVTRVALPSGGDRVMGAGSCSATSCHGGVAAVGGSSVLKNEHTTWISSDPHSRAYQSLLDPRSERIARNLAGRSGPITPAHQDTRCLACHTTPRGPAELERTAGMNADGVGCESCHGAAKDWLGPHTTDGWKNLLPEIKESSYGLKRTKDLADRASSCTDCHVGRRLSPDGTVAKDVNHDLIAAGHPRLNFEFSAYSANMPVHWRVEGRDAAPDFAARAWAVGQAATTRAALELTKDRAGSDKAPWPELSDYDCFSCHHELADDPWRQNRVADIAGILPGSPRWGTWHVPMLRSLAADEGAANRDPGGDWKKIEAAIDQLLGAMSRPGQARADVGAIAESAIAPLDRRLADLSARTYSAAEIERTLAAFNGESEWKRVDNWDHATQRYLAIVPFYQSWTLLAGDRRDGQKKLEGDLERLLGRLKFGDDRDSPPRQFNPTTIRNGP